MEKMDPPWQDCFLVSQMVEHSGPSVALEEVLDLAPRAKLGHKILASSKVILQEKKK